MLRGNRKWFLLGIPVALVVLAVAGTYVYIHFIQADPPPKLTLDTPASSSAGSSSSSASPSSSAAGPAGTVDGTWTATGDSIVGYRVKETLLGQDTEAVGRTSDVTGTFTLSGATVGTAEFTVQMKTVKSDEDRRDSQFTGRIMETSKFPTATFALTSPITLGAVPTDATVVEATATGDLTLHGVTKSVTFTLKAQRDGGNVKVNGEIPITFSDYDISNPSNQTASVGDAGTLEFLLVLTQDT